MSLLSVTLKLTLGLIIIVTNFFVIFAFCRQRRLRTSATNIYLSSLAVSDLLTGIAIIPTYAILDMTSSAFATQPSNCVTIFYFVSTCTISTHLHLFLISTDRYVKVRHDFYYIKHTSIQFAYVACSVAFALSLLFSLSAANNVEKFENGCEYPLMSKTEHSYNFQFFIFYFLGVSMLLTCFFNHRVYQTAASNKKELDTRRAVAEIANNQNDHNNCCAPKLKILKDYKAVLIITAINIGYLITWPLLAFLWLFVNHCEYIDLCDLETRSVIIYLHPWLGLVNSAFNPLILMIMHTDFRQAIAYHVFHKSIASTGLTV